MSHSKCRRSTKAAQRAKGPNLRSEEQFPKRKRPGLLPVSSESNWLFRLWPDEAEDGAARTDRDRDWRSARNISPDGGRAWRLQGVGLLQAIRTIDAAVPGDVQITSGDYCAEL